ncbi:prealbumin-like fold domain-containing protein [Microbacterium aurantiacum]|uniref:prealbumin-like fold domain-containing protein n=1 Tax=Microbacterium aurantiacum TaxID=162393 RepID=UPI003D756D53
MSRRRTAARTALTTIAGAVVAALVVVGAAPAIAAGDATSTPTETPTPTETVTEAPAPTVPESPLATPESTPDATPTAPSRAVRSSDVTTQTVAPMTVTTSSMTVTVRKRALANPTSLGGNVAETIGSDDAGTVGARFRLWTYTSYAAGPRSSTDYTCTITAGGACTITIPDAGGTNKGKRFWVVEEAPVAGSDAANTYINPQLLLGDYRGPVDRVQIAGLTATVAANAAITLPMTSTTTNGGTAISSGDLGNSITTAEGASFGAVANSWKNPVVAAKCEPERLRISLVLDQSASISDSQWTQFRNALVSSGGVLELLRKANAEVSILGFGTNASSNGNGWHYGSTGPALLPSNYASLIPTTRPGGSANATNWDAALSTIQNVNGTHDYDQVLFITDGAPNYILNGTKVSEYDVTLRSLEAPVYAANALKHAGTRVVAVGVGNGITGAGANLRAVSGETLGSDYFQTASWDDVKKQLAQIVQAATCQLPVEVSKTTVDAAGKTTITAGGWAFTAAKTAGDGTLQGTATQTTTAGVNGTADWTLRFAQPTGQSASVTLTETAQSGWTLTKVQCAIGAGGLQDQTIVDGKSVTITGLSTASEKLSCVFTNTEKKKEASVTVDKVWQIKDSSGVVIGTYRQPAEPGAAALPAGLSASPTIGGQPAQWGVASTGFTTGATVALDETVTIDRTALPGCVLTSKALTRAAGKDVNASLPYTATLAEGANAFTMTNVVTCTQTLSLVKAVGYGSASTDAWTLSATKPAGSNALAGPSGTYRADKPVSGAVSTGVAYALGEAGGPKEYVAAGAWTCVAGSTAVPVAASTVTVPLGQSVECTIVNTTAKLTILKEVVGQALAPGDWTLTADPGAGSGLTAKTAIGASQASSANTFEIKPGTAYTLSEAPTAGDGAIAYRQLALERQLADGSWVAVDSDRVTVPASSHATYRFVNDRVPAVVLPLTGGASTDAFLLGGLAVLLLAGALAAWNLRSRFALRRSV